LEEIYAYLPLQFGRQEARKVPLSAGEIVAAVRSALSVTITELASIVGVERPTIYAWLADRAEPYARNRRRLRELFAVARTWAEMSELPAGDPIRREDASGVSVVELLRRGNSAEAVARLRAIAAAASKEPPTGRDVRREKLRAFTEEHGLERDPESEQTAIDILTGKRRSPE
jgi:transcriptional regulator with XRE-family HTH domain